MKIQELRIGNFIYNPIQKINLVVDGSLIATESLREKAIKDYKGFEPIPLTEDWLVRLGFYFWGGSPSYCDRSDFYTITMENGIFYIEYLDINIAFIHQLQNLYFALTGEELTLKNK